MDIAEEERNQYFLNVVEKILRKNKPNIFKED